MVLDAADRGPPVTVPAEAFLVTVAAVALVGAATRHRVAATRHVRAPDTPNGESTDTRTTGRRSFRARTGRIVAATAGLLVVVVLGGPTATVLAAVTVAMVRVARPVVRSRRRRQEIATAFPEAIDLLVHAVQAGLTPYRAVGHLARAAPEAVRPAFATVVRRTERGQSFSDALRALPDELGPPAATFADVIATTDRYGLPLAPALEQLSREAREARRRHADAAARRLPVRLAFPLVACTLPSFVLLAIAPALIAALSSLGGSPF
jgi:tight adherence protein C